MAGRILVLQHSPNSSLGAYGEVLEERGDETVWVRLQLGEAIPSLDGVDALISLGAPSSVYDGDQPWLEAERRLLQGAVAGGVPVWGICFGAQLLASALGARVWPGSGPEVGIHPLRLEPAAAGDPVFSALPETLPMFHWHGDSFDVPEGAELLASSGAYRSQAFRAGRLAYGVQFHAEATPDLVAGWIELPATAAQLEVALGPGVAARLKEEAVEALPEVNDAARQMMAAWREAADEGASGML